MMTALYQNRQIRELEKFAIDEGIEEYQLMLAAGNAAFNTLIAHWPEAKRISICCGKGNNGGDGLVVALLAHEYGLEVSVLLMGELSQLKNAAAKAATACQKAGLSLNQFDTDTQLQDDLIVDALLGSGLSGEVGEPYRSAIAAINAAECPVLAIDVPSGIDVDTGSILGCAVKADVTITFIALKRGLYTAQAPACCGEIVCDSIGVSDHLFRKVEHSAELLNWNRIRPMLPKRTRDTHKGSYGHVLVVGGDYGMGGAVRLAAESAARVGAGLVTVATRPEHVPVVSGSRPELICHQVAEAADLEPLLERASVIVVGPGLGKTSWAISLLNRLLESNLPKVLDADSLNLLSHSPRQANDWILTPHPGEAGRLLDIHCKEVQSDRFKAIDEIQQRYGGVVALKGAGTLIKGLGKMIEICPAGNPGMASAGMGDVLSGIIGGLLAQGLKLQDAAEAGVFIHSVAADRAAEEGGERGLLATDLLPYLRSLVNPNRSSL
ncbi:NAD(P)H-hydrate dehydratase [Candidiatus Paracoxiella cheracis]|uniref:NAD(P)H-hydrate dehydratase n=1 Tax=Candidiatus Paracoxiella cheracis TaxID=3405120 RepID=UPI003BF4639C